MTENSDIEKIVPKFRSNTYQSASVNLPGTISLLTGGGGADCAGVFVFSWRDLLMLVGVEIRLF